MATILPIKPANEAAVDDPKHPFFGQGGSYRFDPATGKTTLIECAGVEATPVAAAPLSNTPTQE